MSTPAKNPTPRSPAAARQAHESSPLPGGVRGSGKTTLRVAYGPLIWLVHFSILYGFNATACARGFPGAVPWVVAGATLALAAAAMLLFMKTPKQQFLDWLTAALAALSLLAILWQALPALLVSPCA